MFNLDDLLIILGSLKYKPWRKKYPLGVVVRGIIDQLTASRIDTSQGLVINGFWRSGTTWFLEVAAQLMHAKSVFEPFAPRAWHIRKCMSKIGVQKNEDIFLETFMPYIDGCINLESKVGALIKNALQSKLVCPATHRGREKLRFCLSKRVALKLVRGSLCLHAIHLTFKVPVIHIYRDPRAVVASIMRIPNWAKGGFERLSLVDQLLGVNDGRFVYFMNWEPEIRRFEKSDPVTRIVAYWALTERFLAESFSKATERFAIIRYEDLLFGGLNILLQAMKEIGCRLQVDSSEVNFAKNSTTTYDDRAYASVSERAFSWQKELTSQEQRTVEKIACKFQFENRLFNSQHIK